MARRSKSSAAPRYRSSTIWANIPRFSTRAERSRSCRTASPDEAADAAPTPPAPVRRRHRPAEAVAPPASPTRTDAVQDTTGPVNPLPDLLCASVVRDGANIVVTAQANNPIPDANRPEAYF